MREETKQEKIEREQFENNCEHKYETVVVPFGWKHLSGVMSCEKCSFGIPIDIDIEQSAK